MNSLIKWRANTAAIQQGGQVRDSFGGIGAAARAAISAINPLTAAIGVAAASIGTLVYAYQGGQGEALAFNRALTLTGNAAGTSVDVLMETASALDQVSGTQRQAAAALAEIVATGKIASDQFANVAAAAMAMEQATGKAVADTVKEFAALADEPAAASAKLNQQYNYLTASVYKQIAALEQQGDKLGAAKLAMEEYGKAAKERSDDIEQSLGYIDRALNGLKAGWREMWDAAFDIGRPETLEEKLADVEQAINQRKNNIYVGSVFDWGPSAEELERQRQGIQLSIQQRDLDAAFISLRAQNAQQEIKAAEEERKATEQLDKSYDSMLASLRQTTALHGQASEVARVRYATEHGELSKLTEAQKAALLVAAQEADAKEAAAEAGRKSAASLREQKSALDALIAKYDPAAKAQAEYEKGIELADEALKNNTYTTEQYQKVVQGLYTDLNKPIWDKQNEASDKAKEALKKLDDQLESVRDRLDPVRAATKRLTAEKELLKEALDKGRISFEEYTQSVALLDKEYDENTRATSEWAKWTEGALDRVDGAFADAWRNIGDGFSSFRDSLTNAFKQMLAELAHMAITRPIVMQIGAALGIGGGAGQAVSMLGGSAGSGGMDVFGLLKNGYSIANSGFGQAVAQGWGNGGFSGAISNGWNYGSNALSSFFGGSSSGAMVDGVYQLGANTMPATVDLIGNTVSQGGNIIGTASGATTTATTWGSAATGLGSIMGGLSGAYMGYQNSGVKGAVAGGLGGWGGGTLGTMAGAAAASALSGTAMGAALGSVLPGIGTVIGAALGAAFGSKLFGGAWETKDAGLAFSVTDGDFLGQQYEYQKKKGGLFSSNKKRTRYSALDEATAARFQEVFASTEATVSSLFESLSYTLDEGSLDGLQLAREKISTKGKTEEEIQQAIAEWFGSAADAMTAELNRVFATGLDLDLAGMQAFVGNLTGVNEVLRYLDVEMYDASVAGGKLAEALSAAAGGLEVLATNSQTYYAAFFSEAEKVEDTIDSIKRTFESADVELASSREAYRAMVEDIDLTTEAGQEMFSTLMQLSGQAAQYYDILEQQGAALIGVAGSAYAALQRSIAAQQRELQAAYSARVGSLNDMAAAASSNLSGMTGIANSLDAALKRLRGTSDDAVRMLRAQAVMTLNSALVTARAGGSLAGFEGLQDALDVASQMDTAMYGSLEDFEREQGRTANLVAELEKVNGKQLTTEERLLETVQDQLAAAQAQYEADMAGLDAQLAAAPLCKLC
ncbi:phage tail length tape measure family protein [Pseudomonas sp. LM13]